MTVNVVERHQNNNSRCFVVPAAHTDQLNNSYFVKTIVQWNTLSEPQVRDGTLNKFNRLSCGLYIQKAPFALIPTYPIATIGFLCRTTIIIITTYSYELWRAKHAQKSRNSVAVNKADCSSAVLQSAMRRPISKD